MLDKHPFRIEVVDIPNGTLKRFIVGIYKFIKKLWHRYIW